MTNFAAYKKPGFFSFGLRQKIGFVLITILLLSLGLSGWHSLRQQKTDVINETKNRGSELARFTSKSIVYAVIGYDYHGIQLLLDELISTQDINYAKVINSKGNIMAKAGRLSIDSDVWTYFEQDIMFDKKHVGTLSIQFDNHRIVSALSKQQSMLIQREVILIFLIALGEYIALSFFIIRPIVLTADNIRKSAEDASLLSENVKYRAKDELGYLFSHFNDMQHRLHTATKKLESKVKIADKEVQEQNSLLQKQSNELKDTNKKLKLLSISDPLTELFNRRHFDILLKKEIAFSQRHRNNVSLIIFDLDHFKNINDKYGHSVGDTVLCSVAKNIETNTRKSDICCRIGGEEFAIICRDTDRNQIISIAEQLRSKLESLAITDKQYEINVTASFGMMTFISGEGKPLSPDDIYHRADMAMYHSKNHGRNCVTHFDDIELHKPNVNHL